MSEAIKVASSGESAQGGVLMRIAISFTAWAERWFPDAFIGVMSNLQRFAASEDFILETSVESAWRTMALVEACYRSSSISGQSVAELSPT